MKIFFVLLAILISPISFSQSSDFVILKKNQRTIKSFFAGSQIEFQTGGGAYSGQITLISKDTIFINEYDIRQVPTNLGVYVIDTIATYRLKFNYKQIIAIGKPPDKKFNWSASGGALFGGGALITTFGLGTWLFTKPGDRYYASPYLVGGAAALAAIGYLLVRSRGGGYKLGKKYILQYVKTK